MKKENLQKCVCTGCGLNGRSVSNTKHRRCPGAVGQMLRPKHDKLPIRERGTWQ